LLPVTFQTTPQIEGSPFTQDDVLSVALVNTFWTALVIPAVGLGLGEGDGEGDGLTLTDGAGVGDRVAAR
jgi:hypothetical protein